VISNVLPSLDDTGEIVNAHEGRLVRWEKGGHWYHYGLEKELCPNAACAGKGAAPQCSCKEKT
jgi:hypothetical protein